MFSSLGSSDCLYSRAWGVVVGHDLGRYRKLAETQRFESSFVVLHNVDAESVGKLDGIIGEDVFFEDELWDVELLNTGTMRRKYLQCYSVVGLSGWRW